jgi:intracellular sulfur oxidation DsrE/DsrF family protein
MRLFLSLPVLAILPWVAHADFSSFTTGPAIRDYGPVTDVEITMPVPKDAVFRHTFDVADPAEDGELNRTLVSAARFINMHARAGIAAERIEVAVIVHGKAIYDVSGDAPANAPLVAALVEHGVRIIVCGQTAAYYDVKTDDLLPGVQVALSAMTAHALLQQQGYTLNPF